MIISNDKKYIYIAVPKTGTTTVQKYLLKNDTTATKNKLMLKGKEYVFREHMNTNQVKQILGENFDDFKVVAFVRHPYGRLVSSYFFYKKGAKRWVWEGKEHKRPLNQKIKIKFAKILPFRLWALVYPYKSNLEYFYDTNNKLLIETENIGIFETLNKDLKKIFLKIGIVISDVPHENKSSHENEEDYFKSKLFRFLIDKKVKKDLIFYNSVIKDKNIRK